MELLFSQNIPTVMEMDQFTRTSTLTLRGNKKSLYNWNQMLKRSDQ
jgi:hypothetical protein